MIDIKEEAEKLLRIHLFPFDKTLAIDQRICGTIEDLCARIRAEEKAKQKNGSLLCQDAENDALKAKIEEYRTERDALTEAMTKWVAREDDLETKIASLEQNITGANELRKEFNSLLETCETLDIKMKAYRESLALWLAYAAGENEPNYDVADEKAAALMAKGEK